MSLKCLPVPPIPEEIAHIAHAAFPRGNIFMQVRDTLGTISTDEAFADLFPTHGRPAEAPWRLALITIFQFMDHLTDRQAADAVRDRLAWKYALSLELTNAGFDHTVLSEFRARLIEGHAEQRLLDLLLERCREGGWLKTAAAQIINSPYDVDARYGKKRTTLWVGYNVHFSQICDEDVPQLMTHVETTPAPLPDAGSLSAIHTSLAEKDLLPDHHLVDAGYVTVATLVKTASDYGVDLVGPTLRTHWYQAETGDDLTHFSLDWEAETVTCPQGRTRSSWTPAQNAGQPRIKVKFSQSDGKICSAQADCTGTSRRTLTFHPKSSMEAFFAARQRESTEVFKEMYRHRAGIEGTHSQAVRALGLRRSRSIGLSRTHLGNVAVAAAINMIQLMHWVRGDMPEQTRTSAFKQVMKQLA